MGSPITAVGHLIHELSNKYALESVEREQQFDQNRGSRPDAERDLKRYNSAYEYKTNMMLYHYGFMTKAEFLAWEKSRESNYYG